MKKAYVKPYIAVESFQLDAAIAASCSADGHVPIGRNETTCSYPNNSGEYFGLDNCLNDMTGRDNKYGDGNDTLCYHGPIALTFIAS